MNFFKILILIFVLNFKHAYSQDAKYFYVLNKNNQVKEIKSDDLKNIFLGKKSFWENGNRILATSTSNDSKSMKKFFESIIGMDQSQYESYWRRQLFSGKGHPPKSFSTDSEVIEFVKKYNNAIGIISEMPKNPDELIIISND